MEQTKDETQSTLNEEAKETSEVVTVQSSQIEGKNMHKIVMNMYLFIFFLFYFFQGESVAENSDVTTETAIVGAALQPNESNVPISTTESVKEEASDKQEQLSQSAVEATDKPEPPSQAVEVESNSEKTENDGEKNIVGASSGQNEQEPVEEEKRNDQENIETNTQSEQTDAQNSNDETTTQNPKNESTSKNSNIESNTPNAETNGESSNQNLQSTNSARSKVDAVFSKIFSNNRGHPLLSRILLGASEPARQLPLPAIFRPHQPANILSSPLLSLMKIQAPLLRRRKHVKRSINEADIFLTPKPFEPFAAQSTTCRPNLIERYRAMNSDERVDRLSKVLERIMHGVTIAGHVDGYLTNRLKTGIKKLHRLFESSE